MDRATLLSLQNEAENSWIKSLKSIPTIIHEFKELVIAEPSADVYSVIVGELSNQMTDKQNLTIQKMYLPSFPDAYISFRPIVLNKTTRAVLVFPVKPDTMTQAIIDKQHKDIL